MSRPHRPRRSYVCALLAGLLLWLAVTPAVAQYQLNLRDADIRAFIEETARVTERVFIIDSRVQGRVSVATDRSLSRSEYFEIFLATLRANGLVAVPLADGSYRIQPLDDAVRQPQAESDSPIDTDTANKLITDIIRLRNIAAAAAMETLRPLVSAQGILTANQNANSLVIVDYADNVARVRALIARIDKDAAAVQLVSLRHAPVREVASAMQSLQGGRGSWQGVQIIPVESSRALMLRGDSERVTEIAALIEQLDQRAAIGSALQVYWLDYADASELVPVLQEIVDSGNLAADSEGVAEAVAGAGAGSDASTESAAASTLTSASGASLSDSPAVVTRYAGANAVIVAAKPAIQQMLGRLISQLDKRRTQILVEAIIVEIGDNAAKDLGVQFLLGGKNLPFAATNFSNAEPNILAIGGAVAAREFGRTTTTVNGNTTVTTNRSQLEDTLQQAAAASALQATGGFGGVFGQSGNLLFGAIINAVQSDTQSNLLATPHIVTLDNQPAKFLVGQEVPVATGEALSENFNNAFRTVQRQEIGIKLEVTPRINSAGEVTLLLTQEVSSLAGPVSRNNADLIVNKRSFETVLTLQDGEIMAIGGLLNDDERRTIEKIPLLGDIPLLGNLFRSRGKVRRKTNLMIFIRPTILSDSADSRAFTARRYGYIRDTQLRNSPDEDAALDLLVRDYMGAAIPRADDGDTVRVGKDTIPSTTSETTETDESTESTSTGEISETPISAPPESIETSDNEAGRGSVTIYQLPASETSPPVATDDSSTGRSASEKY